MEKIGLRLTSSTASKKGKRTTERKIKLID
jgi:hypothetical protein